ncbi:MAG: FAD-dependent oxidoreductase [Tepidisphaeraceae bacterium]
MHDVAIIGAGPAGCAAAIALRRLGRAVLLIEQQRFPRDKVCGAAAVSPAALRGSCFPCRRCPNSWWPSHRPDQG